MCSPQDTFAVVIYFFSSDLKETGLVKEKRLNICRDQTRDQFEITEKEKKRTWEWEINISFTKCLLLQIRYR